MRKFLTLMICVMVAGVTVAQENGSYWGVKAGLNLSNFIGKDVEGASMKAGFNIGLVKEFRASEKFAVAPELVFSTQGYSMKYKGESMSMNAMYINLPIMAKYYVLNNLSIDLGPQFGYALSMKMESEKADRDTYNAFDIALGVGATYYFNKFLANIRYNYGLTDVFKNAKNKNSVFQIGIGYKF